MATEQAHHVRKHDAHSAPRTSSGLEPEPLYGALDDKKRLSMRTVLLTLGWALVISVLVGGAALIGKDIFGAVFFLELGLIIAAFLIRSHRRRQRTVGAPAQPKLGTERPKRTSPDRVLTFTADQGDLTVAVGEPVHTANFRRVLLQAHKARKPNVENLTTIDLVRDPHNQRDGNAVAIHINGLVLGHLDHAASARYAPVLDVLAKRGARMQVAGRIWLGLGHDCGDDYVGFVQVWLPWADAIRESMQPSAFDQRQTVGPAPSV